MERNTAFFKEHLIRKAMGQPATTSNKNHKGTNWAGWYRRSLSSQLTFTF